MVRGLKKALQGKTLEFFFFLEETEVKFLLLKFFQYIKDG